MEGSRMVKAVSLQCLLSGELQPQLIEIELLTRGTLNHLSRRISPQTRQYLVSFVNKRRRQRTEMVLAR